MFSVSPGIDAVLREDYMEGYSFVICCLRGKNVKDHPIAFVHEPHSDTQLFVPTKHAHGGKKETVSDWDHEIYSFNTVDAASAGPTPSEALKVLEDGPGSNGLWNPATEVTALTNVCSKLSSELTYTWPSQYACQLRV